MFVDHCRENDIASLTDLDGIDLHEYRIEQAEGIARRTLVSRLSSLRVFLRWAESIGAVEQGFHEKVIVPDVDSRRSSMINSDRAQTILEYLRRYEYASRDHLVIRLFWRTGMRLGALRGLDLDDYFPSGNDETDEPFLQLHHRPDTGTPLKNGKAGERPVGISDETRLLIDDYLENNRVDITDNNGRASLLTTKRGRPGIATFRRTVYRYTRPCAVGEDCPHDRTPSDCEATENTDKASLCPSTVSPHDVRRGAITHLLRNDVPKPIVSDRCDVSPDVLDKHYDQRSDLEKMEQRRNYLDNL